MKDWIQLYTGGKFRPLAPSVKDIHIEDIARALSNICRYGGMVSRFYSVAEHSIHISYVAQQRLIARGVTNKALTLDLIKWGLLHDATEAYIADVSRPVKHTPEMFAYRAIELKLTQAIADRFKLALPEPGFIQDLDKEILGTEVAQLKTPIDPDWELAPIMPELAHTRMGWAPEKAERMFLERFAELFGADP